MNNKTSVVIIVTIIVVALAIVGGAAWYVLSGKQQSTDQTKLPGSHAGCIDRCGDGTCQEVVCLATNCPCAETLNTCPRDCNKEHVVSGCKNLWWYDSEHSTCQQPKQFCGAYMYQGLQTFETKEACEQNITVRGLK